MDKSMRMRRILFFKKANNLLGRLTVTRKFIFFIPINTQTQK
jgi:hypothetical protein